MTFFNFLYKTIWWNSLSRMNIAIGVLYSWISAKVDFRKSLANAFLSLFPTQNVTKEIFLLVTESVYQKFYDHQTELAHFSRNSIYCKACILRKICSELNIWVVYRCYKEYWVQGVLTIWVPGRSTTFTPGHKRFVIMEKHCHYHSFNVPCTYKYSGSVNKSH